jgi:hypothetical protein
LGIFLYSGNNNNKKKDGIFEKQFSNRLDKIDFSIVKEENKKIFINRKEEWNYIWKIFFKYHSIIELCRYQHE